MQRPFIIAFAPAFALLVACDGKPESAATPAVDSAVVAPASLDSGAAAADSLATPTGDSAARPAKPTGSAPVQPKVETGDYDKAIRPRFRIDEKTGKIDTIKRP